MFLDPSDAFAAILFDASSCFSHFPDFQLFLRIHTMKRCEHMFTRTGFLASSWHITSHSMFAGSCIGAICLVIVLVFLRRVQREFDKFIAPNSAPSVGAGNGHVGKKADSSSEEHSLESSLTEDGRMGTTLPQGRLACGRLRAARLTLLQQATRATIHMLQFALAYFIMLLPMYFNSELAFLPSLLSLDAIRCCYSFACSTDGWFQTVSNLGYINRLHHHLYLYRCVDRLVYILLGSVGYKDTR